MKVFKIIAGSIIFLALSAAGVFAKPCECKDMEKIKAEIARTSTAEAAWMEIFAWARGLREGVKEPASNDELNTRYLQLARAPRSDWNRIMTAPIGQIETPEKAGGLDKNGEPVVNAAFQASNCDEIVEGVKVHERAHRDFFLSADKLAEGSALTWRLLRTRAESEVVSYRAQTAYLKGVLEKLKCGGELEYHMIGVMSMPMIGTFKFLADSTFPFTIDENKKIEGGGIQKQKLDASGSVCTVSGYKEDNEWAVSGEEQGEFLQFKFSPKGDAMLPSIQMKCSVPGQGQGFGFSLPVPRGLGDVRMEKKDGAKQEVDLAGITGGLVTGKGVLTLHLDKK
jgi:hypothetical protein